MLRQKCYLPGLLTAARIGSQRVRGPLEQWMDRQENSASWGDILVQPSNLPPGYSSPQSTLYCLQSTFINRLGIQALHCGRADGNILQLKVRVLEVKWLSQALSAHR